jgi:aldose 1-epimerase
VLDRKWECTHRDGEISCRHAIDLGPDWPWPGGVDQSLTLRSDGLECQLEIFANRGAFPASFGWHPWFRRQLEHGGEAELEFDGCPQSGAGDR